MHPRTEVPPTADEVELYYTARDRLSAGRLEVLHRYGAKLPHAEAYYQAHVACMAQVDIAMDSEIRVRRDNPNA